MDNFEYKINHLDLELFRHIGSQSTTCDKRSLLALQVACRQTVSDYSWLEIGSHLGGSLQALVVDPKCMCIISIDPRPQLQPDERGQNYHYTDNSTERMLDLLQKIPGAHMAKLRTIDAGTDTIQTTAITERPNVCFIDGEHTDASALRDARFCLSIVAENGCIAFHDAQIIYRGLNQFIQELTADGRVFRAYNLPDSVFVVELGACGFSATPHIRCMLENNHTGYLWSLMANDEYRQDCMRPIVHAARVLDQIWSRLLRIIIR